jgi:hypothetical protein
VRRGVGRGNPFLHPSPNYIWQIFDIFIYKVCAFGKTTTPQLANLAKNKLMLANFANFTPQEKESWLYLGYSKDFSYIKLYG